MIIICSSGIPRLFCFSSLPHQLTSSLCPLYFGLSFSSPSLLISYVNLLLISSPSRPSWLLSLMWFFCVCAFLCLYSWQYRVNQLWLKFFWLIEKLSAKLKSSSPSTCTASAAVNLFALQSITSSPQYVRVLMRSHTSQRTCQLMCSSVLLEQYMVWPLFMFKLFYPETINLFLCYSCRCCWWCSIC